MLDPRNATWLSRLESKGPNFVSLLLAALIAVEVARIAVALVSGPVKSPRPVIAANMQLHPTAPTGVNAQAVAAAHLFGRAVADPTTQDPNNAPLSSANLVLAGTIAALAIIWQGVDLLKSGTLVLAGAMLVAAMVPIALGQGPGAGARASMAKVIIGGQSDPDVPYLAPTIVYPVMWEDKIMADEIFGPVLPVLTYKSLDEALHRMAATGSPLAGYVYSSDQATIDRFVGELSYGGGGVNVANVYLFVETMPFGGVGPAGMGHYYGRYGFEQLTHAKSVLISPPDVAIEHMYPPFNDEKVAELSQWFDY